MLQGSEEHVSKNGETDIRDSVFEASQTEIKFFLQAEEEPGEAEGYVTELQAMGAGELTGVDELPHAFNFRKPVASVLGRELAAVLVIEQIGVDEIEPTHVLVEGEDGGREVQVTQLGGHAVVGFEVVEAAQTHAVCHREGMLAVKVGAGTTTHLS